MFNELIELEEYKLLQVETTLKNINENVRKLIEIKFKYNTEIDNKKTKDMQQYLENSMNVTVLLGEIKKINQQIFSLNQKAEHVSKQRYKINLNIEKYKHLNEVEKHKIEKMNEEKENDEIHELSILLQLINK